MSLCECTCVCLRVCVSVCACVCLCVSVCVCGNRGRGLPALTPQEVGALLTAQHPACSGHGHLTPGGWRRLVGSGWVFHNDSFLKVTLTPGWALLGTGQGGKHRKSEGASLLESRVGGEAGGAGPQNRDGTVEQPQPMSRTLRAREVEGPAGAPVVGPPPRPGQPWARLVGRPLLGPALAQPAWGPASLP